MVEGVLTSAVGKWILDDAPATSGNYKCSAGKGGTCSSLPSHVLPSHVLPSHSHPTVSSHHHSVPIHSPAIPSIPPIPSPPSLHHPHISLPNIPTIPVPSPQGLPPINVHHTSNHPTTIINTPTSLPTTNPCGCQEVSSSNICPQIACPECPTFTCPEIDCPLVSLDCPACVANMTCPSVACQCPQFPEGQLSCPPINATCGSCLPTQLSCPSCIPSTTSSCQVAQCTCAQSSVVDETCPTPILGCQACAPPICPQLNCPDCVPANLQCNECDPISPQGCPSCSCNCPASTGSTTNQVCNSTSVTCAPCTCQPCPNTHSLATHINSTFQDIHTVFKMSICSTKNDFEGKGKHYSKHRHSPPFEMVPEISRMLTESSTTTANTDVNSHSDYSAREIHTTGNSLCFEQKKFLLHQASLCRPAGAGTGQTAEIVCPHRIDTIVISRAVFRTACPSDNCPPEAPIPQLSSSPPPNPDPCESAVTSAVAAACTGKTAECTIDLSVVNGICPNDNQILLVLFSCDHPHKPSHYGKDLNEKTPLGDLLGPVTLLELLGGEFTRPMRQLPFKSTPFGAMPLSKLLGGADAYADHVKL